MPIPSDEPRYCGTAQVAYPKAPPHTRPGPNRVAAFGHHAITAAIDPTWKATDFTDAVLVLCAGGPEPGTALGRACTYLDRDDKPTITVPLHAASYPIRAFELRTGQLIGQTAIETRGHCPRYLFDPRAPHG